MSSDTVKKDEPESKRPRIEAPSDNNHAGGGDVVSNFGINWGCLTATYACLI
jgi:hypothetical protein